MKFDYNLKVSAIIPTHNRAQLLSRSINSVLSQTLQPAKIIVIDDGSSDETKALIDKDFPMVEYHYQENRGISSARNLGIRKSQSEWIAFLDSDDEWMPEKLLKQATAISEDPEMKICYTNEIWIRRGRRVNQKKKHAKYGGYIFKHCLPLCIISPSSVIIHRSIFEEAGLFDETLPVCEDYDLWLRICSGWPVLYLDEPLIVKYGGHSDQLSRRYWGMDRFRIKALEKIINSGDVNAEDRIAATKMLLKKMEIIMEGTRKRNKRKELEGYEKKLATYKLMLKNRSGFYDAQDVYLNS